MHAKWKKGKEKINFVDHYWSYFPAPGDARTACRYEYLRVETLATAR